MANEVMTSLFGVTPESLMAQRQAEAQAQAYKYAALDPMQQAQAGFYMAGNRLGSAVGGLLGSQDPELQRAKLLNDISRQFDLTTIQGASDAIKALSSAGLTKEAFALSDRLNQMKKTEAETLRATRGNVGTQTERSRALISQAEIKLAKGEPLSTEESANLRWLVAQETKPKAFRDTDTGELITIQPLDIAKAAPNIAKFLQGDQAAMAAPAANGAPTEVGQTTSPAPGVTVTKIGEGKGLEPTIIKDVGLIDANLKKLNSSVSYLNTLGTKIEGLDVGFIQNLARGGAAALGINTKDRIAFDELKRTAIEEANNLLLLAKGAQTEGDAQRAYNQIADENTWKNKDALKAAFEGLKKTHQRTIEALNAQRTTLTSKGKAPAPGSSEYTPAQEATISRWMAANKRSREEVISYLKSQGKL